MRKDIEFKTTDGTTLRGWHYLPDGSGKHATIVMTHGFSAVKEMYLDKYADSFAKAGFASVVYDNRNFGASDGQPRQEIDPWLQVRDYSDAITFALSLDQTDVARIGVWGSSPWKRRSRPNPCAWHQWQRAWMDRDLPGPTLRVTPRIFVGSEVQLKTYRISPVGLTRIMIGAELKSWMELIRRQRRSPAVTS